MNSVVLTAAVSPVHERPAFTPKRLWLLEPSAALISRLPQPDSSAAWPMMKCAGIPVAFAASTACGHILLMNSRALPVAPTGGATGAAAVVGVTGAGACLLRGA